MGVSRGCMLLTVGHRLHKYLGQKLHHHHYHHYRCESGPSVGVEKVETDVDVDEEHCYHLSNHSSILLRGFDLGYCVVPSTLTTEKNNSCRILLCLVVKAETEALSPCDP